MGATKYLPANYRHKKTLNLSRTRAVLWMNLAAIPLLVFFGWLFSYLISIFNSFSPFKNGIFGFFGTFSILEFLFCILIIILMLILHELIHGMFFWLFTHDKPRFALKTGYAFAAAPEWYLTKKQYIIVGLSPFLIISITSMKDKMATHPYERVKQFSIKLSDELVEVSSKPGLADWDKLLPSTALLAEHPRVDPSDHVLLMGCHHGALGVFIAQHLPVGQLSITDNNYIALEMTRKTLASNNISNVNLYPDANLPATEDKKYNAVFIQIPKGRKLCRRWLLQAHQVLIPGGNVYIAGSKQAGIQSSIKDASELFGIGRIMAYKKGYRLCHLVKQLEKSSFPDWANSPGIT